MRDADRKTAAVTRGQSRSGAGALRLLISLRLETTTPTTQRRRPRSVPRARHKRSVLDLGVGPTTAARPPHGISHQAAVAKRLALLQSPKARAALSGSLAVDRPPPGPHQQSESIFPSYSGISARMRGAPLVSSTPCLDGHPTFARSCRAAAFLTARARTLRSSSARSDRADSRGAAALVRAARACYPTGSCRTGPPVPTSPVCVQVLRSIRSAPPPSPAPTSTSPSPHRTAPPRACGFPLI